MRYEKRKVDDIFRRVDQDISREKLQHMAEEEGIEINWDKWDEITIQTRLEITNLIKPKHKNSTQPKYIYTLGGKLIKSFNTTRECAEYYGIAPEAVCTYARSEKPYYKLGIIITNELKDNKNKPKYVYTVEWKLVGIYPNSMEVEKKLGIPKGVVNQYANHDKPYIKKGLWFRNSPINTDKEEEE